MRFPKPCFLEVLLPTLASICALSGIGATNFLLKLSRTNFM